MPTFNITLPTYDLELILDKFIKPDYHAAVRLILVDYTQFPDVLPYGINTYTDNEFQCKPLVKMITDKPHTMEYVNWGKVFNEAPYIVVQIAGGSFGPHSLNFEVYISKLKTIQLHLRDNYPEVWDIMSTTINPCI